MRFGSLRAEQAVYFCEVRGEREVRVTRERLEVVYCPRPPLLRVTLAIRDNSQSAPQK